MYNDRTAGGESISVPKHYKNIHIYIHIHMYIHIYINISNHVPIHIHIQIPIYIYITIQWNIVCQACLTRNPFEFSNVPLG